MKNIQSFPCRLEEQNTCPYNKQHSIKNYTGLPNVTGNELANDMKKHLESLDIEITDKKVNAVYSMGKFV